jgi:hypothetical protein
MRDEQKQCEQCGHGVQVVCMKCGNGWWIPDLMYEVQIAVQHGEVACDGCGNTVMFQLRVQLSDAEKAMHDVVADGIGCFASYAELGGYFESDWD